MSEQKKRPHWLDGGHGEMSDFEVEVRDRAMAFARAEAEWIEQQLGRHMRQMGYWDGAEESKEAVAREVGHLYEVQQYPHGSAEMAASRMMQRRTDLAHEGTVFAWRDVWWDEYVNGFVTEGFGLPDMSEKASEG